MTRNRWDTCRFAKRSRNEKYGDGAGVGGDAVGAVLAAMAAVA